VSQRGGLIQLDSLAARAELPGPGSRPELSPLERARLQRRAKLLAWGGNAWHLIEFAIAVGAGIAAGSIALLGFGIDSLIESLAAFVIVWRFGARRAQSETAERRAQQLVAGSYAILVVYVLVESTRTLIGGHHPDASWIGIGLAAFTAPTMPLLAAAKRRVGRNLGSAATVSEAEQNQICAYLSIALLVGLLANALLGWWWADPAAAFVIAGIAAREGYDSWQGKSCDCC
jgi:divalent metal cation (Fe/Co/Zn/Cd) transporter